MERIIELKNTAINSIGIEISPTNENTELFQEINKSNIKAITQIDWLFVYENPKLRELKKKFVKRLVEEGVEIYPLFQYDKKGTSFEEGEKKLLNRLSHIYRKEKNPSYNKQNTYL